MTKQNKALLWWIIFIVAVIGGILAIATFASSRPAALDSFALCLEEKGALFYGAFWCPHCADQKKLFGRSVSKIPYVECSTADGRGQLQVCTDAGITAYPTWKFADDTRETRVISLRELSERTSCPLPDESVTGSEE